MIWAGGREKNYRRDEADGTCGGDADLTGIWTNDEDDELGLLGAGSVIWFAESEKLIDVLLLALAAPTASLRALYSASWVCSCCITSLMGTAWSASESPCLNGRIMCRTASVLTVTWDFVSEVVYLMERARTSIRVI